jgi:tRNA (guanine37-N1)-methyltransferase
MLQVDVITIFPGLFEAFLGESIVGIAIRNGKLRVEVHDLRRWAGNRHGNIDDSPYGGGPGMVMRPEPLVSAIEDVAGRKGGDRCAKVTLLSPQGERLDQHRLAGMVEEERIVLVCGRYEGVDQRAIDLAVDDEVSLGDYVLSGGEVPAMVLIEGAARLLPGVLGNPDSTAVESFQGPFLEGPQYTRPAEYRGCSVPDVLLSGDHGAVAQWRREQSIATTRKRRPDLLERPEGERES